MENNYTDLEFIESCELVAALCTDIRSLGLVAVCNCCDDLDAVVVAFAVSEASKQAWPLCASYLRKVSQLDAVI